MFIVSILKSKLEKCASRVSLQVVCFLCYICEKIIRLINCYIESLRECHMAFFIGFEVGHGGFRQLIVPVR